MDTRESSAPLAHPSTDDHDATVETHYSGLECPVSSETDTLKGRSSSPCEANPKELFTEARSRWILRTSPSRSSKKLAKKGLKLAHFGYALSYSVGYKAMVQRAFSEEITQCC